MGRIFDPHINTYHIITDNNDVLSKVGIKDMSKFRYLRLGHNYYSIFITNKASLLVYDVLVKQYTDQQTSREEEINIYSN